MSEHAGGLPWLTVPVPTLLAGASLNAWALLVGPGEEMPAAESPGRMPL